MMAYRDCGYSKGSGSEAGSTTLPFSDEIEDEDAEQKAQVVIPEEQRRVLDWLHFGHYSQQGQIIDKPAQPVVTSSTCDEKVIPVAPKTSKKDKTQSVKGFGFYNWCKSNTSCGGYSSPVSPASDDKNDLYEDEPLALIVPSKRRISDLDHSWQLTKVLEQQNNRQTLTVEEALQHGEVFLEWLRASSDPNVTVLQAMQIGALIKNIRSSLQRNQNRR